MVKSCTLWICLHSHDSITSREELLAAEFELQSVPTICVSLFATGYPFHGSGCGTNNTMDLSMIDSISIKNKHTKPHTPCLWRCLCQVLLPAGSMTKAFSTSSTSLTSSGVRDLGTVHAVESMGHHFGSVSCSCLWKDWHAKDEKYVLVVYPLTIPLWNEYVVPLWNDFLCHFIGTTAVICTHHIHDMVGFHFIILRLGCTKTFYKLPPFWRNVGIQRRTFMK